MHHFLRLLTALGGSWDIKRSFKVDPLRLRISYDKLPSISVSSVKDVVEYLKGFHLLQADLGPGFTGETQEVGRVVT